MAATSLAEHERSSNALPEGVKINSLEPRCEKCFAPLASRQATVCKRCGWYASTGTYVEIDHAWEGEAAPASPDAGKLPRWAWLAIASVAAVIVESTIVRCVTADGGFARMAWSGAQFVLGWAAALACQIAGFVILMRQDSTASVLDVILKPFKISGMLFRELPKRFWIVNSGISGLAAALAAMAIIGSVPYHALWSWTVDYRSSQDLEDALAQEGSAGPSRKAQQDEPARTTIDCLILGYNLNEDGNLSTVLVARADLGKLRYVGSVVPTGDPALLFELRENLLAATQREPAIPMQFTSNWVAPKFTCQISYTFEQENKTLTDLRWEGDVRAFDTRE